MSEEEILATYIKLKKEAKEKLSTIKKKINLIVLIRVLVFVGTGTGVYFLTAYPGIAIATAIIGMLVFVYFIQKHGQLQVEKRFQEQLIQIKQDEIDAKENKWDHFYDGEDYIQPDHPFSYDIDLFGNGSFFQFFNRTKTKGGEKNLYSILTSNDTNKITINQNINKDLKNNINLRQSYLAKAASIQSDIKSTTIENWIKNYKPFLLSKFAFVGGIIFSVLSIVFIFMLSLNMISGTMFSAWFILGLMITGSFLKKINAVVEDANKIEETISQYSTLLDLIEKENFNSKDLKDLQSSIEQDHTKASVILKQFGRKLNRVNSRNNLIISIFGNALFLYDIQAVHGLEKWLTNFREQIHHWFDAIYKMDAYLSMSNYAYNHPNYVFPTISKDASITIATKEIGHPLISEKKRINNDFEIKDGNFIIITGANMAGKSTFLRTISLNLVLANSGMPVSAKSFNYTPIKLITSMRTSDSLQKEESYFFSELKRLKYIVENIQKEKYFIILDEILKGTNSKDKEQGSKKFVHRLVKSGSTGIIATHDLALCELQNEFPQVINHYFDAEIINDELHFDYKFKDGVCQNMNASFLLKKMDIVE